MFPSLPTRSIPAAAMMLGLATLPGCRPAEEAPPVVAVDLSVQPAPQGLLDKAWNQWQTLADRSRTNACALVVSPDPEIRRQVDSVAVAVGAWPRGASARTRDSICAVARAAAGGPAVAP